MLKAEDIYPGMYEMRNKQRVAVKRVWMGVIYSVAEDKVHNSSKYIWFDNGHYNLDCRQPHEFDLIKRIQHGY